MRWFLQTCAVVCASTFWFGPSEAQTFPVFGQDSKIAVLDQAVLFNQSKFGKHHIALLNTATKLLDAENKNFETELELEEAEITELRKTLSSEEFQTRALEFDAKVKSIRQEQSQKSRQLSVTFNSARDRFSTVLNPMLQQLIEEQGIEVLLSKDTVIAFKSNRDITTLAIRLMDQRLVE